MDSVIFRSDATFHRILGTTRIRDYEYPVLTAARYLQYDFVEAIAEKCILPAPIINAAEWSAWVLEADSRFFVFDYDIFDQIVEIIRTRFFTYLETNGCSPNIQNAYTEIIGEMEGYAYALLELQRIDRELLNKHGYCPHTSVSWHKIFCRGDVKPYVM